MTIGKAPEGHLVAQADVGFTPHNAAYFKNRYSIKQARKSDEHVKLYEAEDLFTGKEVLLKEYDNQAWMIADKESAALAAIKSPRVVKLLDTVRVSESRAGRPGEADLKTYLVFEPSVPVKIDSEKAVWSALAQVSEGVSDAHRADRVVGDLQFENLLGNEHGVVIGDLSASKMLHETGNETSSEANDVRAIYKLGAEMLKDLGKRTDTAVLSPVARAFIAKAEGGGGASFWNLNRYLKKGAAENRGSDPTFVKAKL